MLGPKSFDAFDRTVAQAPLVRVEERGRLEAQHDGVLTISGMPRVGADEVIDLDGVRAWVTALHPDHLFAVALDDTHRLKSGTRARRTSETPRVPVGDVMLGRVVDPLGRAFDGGEEIRSDVHRPIFATAPALHARSEVSTPLYTGSLVVDALCPVARGQRELILGDEGTGKTALAVGAMLRQAASSEVVCIYAAIGRRRNEVGRIVDQLQRAGGKWTVVSAPDDLPPGLRVLAPFAACAIAEEISSKGGHALVVYDDLSSHGIAWRELSLLLRRPPGREAYPGDIFSLHATLLERAVQLAPSEGGGSITALPIARLESGRLSGYIPTNLISITDGQIVLNRSLFVAGQRPAVDVGLSVSRVGGRAQAPVLRALSNRLKLNYAAFLELEAFARLGTRVDAETTSVLERGRRTRQLFIGGAHQPLGVLDEVLRLHLANHDAIQHVPIAALDPADPLGVVARADAQLPGLRKRLTSTGRLEHGDAAALASICNAAVSLAVESALDDGAASPSEQPPSTSGSSDV